MNNGGGKVGQWGRQNSAISFVMLWVPVKPVYMGRVVSISTCPSLIGLRKKPHVLVLFFQLERESKSAAPASQIIYFNKIKDFKAVPQYVGYNPVGPRCLLMDGDDCFEISTNVGQIGNCTKLESFGNLEQLFSIVIDVRLWEWNL